MKGSKVLIFITLVFAVSCASVGKYDPKGEHVLWKVDNGDNFVYLLGSIHVGKKEIYPLADTIEQAYNKSENLAVEVNLDDSSVDIQKILEYGIYQSDTTLQQVVSPETYKIIEEKLKGFASPLIYRKYRPWFAQITIMQLEMLKAGYDGKHGMDKYYLGKAKADGKDIVSLEEIDTQLQLFKMFDQAPDDYLQVSLNDLNDFESEIDVMYKAWHDGDLDALQGIVDKSSGISPELDNIMNEVLYKRNISMTEKIEELINSGESSFIVVGSAHLIGEGSIIDLLKKSGKYNIDRI